MGSKRTTVYLCQECKYQASKWMGKCPKCESWNSFIEEVYDSVSKNSKKNNVKKENHPQAISKVESENDQRTRTGVDEFDRVLGGGLVEGSLILIGGEPGIGKSTLLINIMGHLAGRCPEDKALYVSGEESIKQIAERAKRLGVDNSNIYLLNESNWQSIQNEIKKMKPKYMVLDSIQTTTIPHLASAPGTTSQVREVTYELMNHVKETGISCFVVGHITKEGGIAGPKILEHMVDTVIYFEGDQDGHYRLLRAIKNRFGNTNEVGIFEMKEGGLDEVRDPSHYFLDNNDGEACGRAITCVLEGSRSLFVEVQSLVVENKHGNGRRVTQGITSSKLAMIVAVIGKYFSVPLDFNDIYLNVVGGMEIKKGDSDLAILASLLSSYRGCRIDSRTVFLGEVGLTGEVRSAPHSELRLRKMNQLKYKKVITSHKISEELGRKYNLEIIGIKTVKEVGQYIA